MKKIVSFAMGALMLGGMLSAAACNPTPAVTEFDVYAPDGAPALALVNAIAAEDDTFTYHVVDSSTIQTYVTGTAPEAAEYCILPVNLASRLLGTGERYQMLGTVTNGNLYFLSTGSTVLTAENIASELPGKTIGVVQLANVPGLTLQAVLASYDIEYQQITSLEDENRSQTAVNLLAMNATDVTPAGGCDYYLCPEPAATTKINGTASAAAPLVPAGDLQALYGDGEGYPQAVLVARSDVVDEPATEALIGYMQGSAEYLADASPETVLTLLDDKRTEGLAPSFNANNLNATVIANCSVRFVPAQQDKARVTSFLSELIAVNANAAATVSDAFFFAG